LGLNIGTISSANTVVPAVRGLTNKAQLLLLIFNFIKKPGSGSGRTNIKFPTIDNTWPLCGMLTDIKVKIYVIEK